MDYDDGGNPAKRAAIWEDVVGRSSTIPGVEASGISDNLPMSRNRSWGIAAKGEEMRNTGVFVYIVSPGYPPHVAAAARLGETTWRWGHSASTAR